MYRGVLGDFVDLKRKQNKELITKSLVGVDVNKNLIEDIIGNSHDLSKLQVVEKGNFIVNLMHVGRDKRVPVALYENQCLALTSPSYRVFLASSSQLIDKFLLLLLRRSKTDLMCSYYAEKDIRGALAWKDFMKLPIFVPALDLQELIVNRYEVLEKVIQLKKEINEKLERWMQSLFHIWFDNLEENQYSYKTFGELFTIVRGGRPPRGNKAQEQKYFCKEGGVPSLTVSDINKYNTKFVGYVEEYLTEEGLKKSKTQIISPHNLIFIGGGVNAPQLGKVKINFCNLTINSTLWALLSNPEKNLFSFPLTFSYFLIKENTFSLKKLINSSTDRVSFDLKSFKSFEVKLPPKHLIERFHQICSPMFELQKFNELTINKSLRLQKCIVESLD